MRRPPGIGRRHGRTRWGGAALQPITALESFGAGSYLSAGSTLTIGTAGWIGVVIQLNQFTGTRCVFDDDTTAATGTEVLFAPGTGTVTFKQASGTPADITATSSGTTDGLIQAWVCRRQTSSMEVACNGAAFGSSAAITGYTAGDENPRVGRTLGPNSQNLGGNRLISLVIGFDGGAPTDQEVADWFDDVKATGYATITGKTTYGWTAADFDGSTVSPRDGAVSLSETGTLSTVVLPNSWAY